MQGATSIQCHSPAYGQRAEEHDPAFERLARLGDSVVDLSPAELGSLGEDLAAEALANEGYQIADRNWVCPKGEADIVAFDGGDCVLVEVKTRLVRPNAGNVWPELAVGAQKRRRYEGIAQCYLLYSGLAAVRFDVVAVSVRVDGTFELRHIVSAFGREA